MKNTVYVDAIGLSAPGLKNWKSSINILSGGINYSATKVDFLKPKILPSNERRRTTQLIRLAFNSCEQILEQIGTEKLQIASIFSSSGGDYEILDKNCKVLSTHTNNISPTYFHNSVHNATAGYWSLALKNTKTYTSLSAGEYTFAISFLEAVNHLIIDNEPVFLCVFDMFTTPPMYYNNPVENPFSAAFKFSPKVTEDSFVKLTYNTGSMGTPTRCQNPSIEKLKQDNPSARSLILLEAIAMVTNSIKMESNISIEQSEELLLNVNIKSLK